MIKKTTHVNISLLKENESTYGVCWMTKIWLHQEIPGNFVIQRQHSIQHCKASLESKRKHKQNPS